MRESAESWHDWLLCYHRYAPAFPRLVVQQGLFTVASKPNLDHWEVAKRLVPESRHHEIHFPGSIKLEIVARLNAMGVTTAALFPGVEGVASGIPLNLWIRHETDTLDY